MQRQNGGREYQYGACLVERRDGNGHPEQERCHPQARLGHREERRRERVASFCCCKFAAA